jgi:hypothetical protein
MYRKIAIKCIVCEGSRATFSCRVLSDTVVEPQRALRMPSFRGFLCGLRGLSGSNCFATLKSGAIAKEL